MSGCIFSEISTSLLFFVSYGKIMAASSDQHLAAHYAQKYLLMVAASDVAEFGKAVVVVHE